MKYMKNLTHILGLILLIATVCIAASSASAQNRERFGISAKAGGINAVLGDVRVIRADKDSAQLTNTDDLVAGDIVTSGSQSYVEVLLSPGSYFRVRENSEFHFEDSTLDHLRLKLVKGSAIVEVTGVENMEMNIRVITAQAQFTIMRSGVYRIDVQPDFSELSVRKGRAAFGPDKADVVKGGQSVTFRNGQMARGKITKDKDDFDLWSIQRAELLARANDRLSSRVFSGYVAEMSERDSRWGSGAGIWAFNPRAGLYTFMPFYYGWSSPYGHRYGSYCPINPWYGRNSSGPRLAGGNNGPGWGSSGSSGGGGGGVSGGGVSGGGSGASSPRPEPRPMRDSPVRVQRNREP